MKRVALVLVAFVLLARAATAGEAYDEIKLSDGRVLHQVEIKSDQPASVTILCKDGLLSVAKRLLPPELAAKHPVRAAEESAAPSLPRAPSGKPPAPNRHTGSVSPAGCRIVSMQDKNGAADVALENETDHPIQFQARALICQTSAGQSFSARYLTYVAAGRSLDDPSAPATVVRGSARFELPGHTAMTVRVSFFDQDLDTPKLIERVAWAGSR